jgi:hypothetical protein
MTIAFNESTVKGTSSGLSISSWISNGTDVLASPLFGGIKPRLLPSIPINSDGCWKVAFQISNKLQTASYTSVPGVGPFTGEYGTDMDWLVVDQAHYGGLGVNLFVFDVDERGNATAVSPVVTRLKLVKRA